MNRYNTPNRLSTDSGKKYYPTFRYPTIVEKKREQNYVFVVKLRLKQNMMFTLQHMRMVMPFKCVKVGCQV